MNEHITKYISKIRSPKSLIIAGVIGLSLIYLSTAFSKNPATPENTDTTAITAQEYREQLEEDICKMVTNITGSKKATVVVTLESGVKYSYADVKEESVVINDQNDTKNSDTALKEGYITVKTADGGEQALLITEQMPEVRGVAIVCEGGDNEIINQKIKSTVTAALNITSKRVYICGGKQQ